MRIKSINEAYYLFKRILKSRACEVIRVTPTNFGRHRIVHVKMWYRGVSSNVKFYLIFQRKPFESFEKYFNFPSKAFSINKSILEEIIKMGIDGLVFIDELGNCYYINPRIAYKIAKEKGWIRKTKRTGEIVVHIPIVILEKIHYNELDRKITSFT